MADAKKSTAPKKKSTTTTKAKTTTKPAAAKTKTATTRKAAAVTATPKKRPAAPVKQPFMSMQPTRETTYWLIFSLLILALGIWVLTLTIKINDIYDQIEANDSTLMLSTPTVFKPVEKAE